MAEQTTAQRIAEDMGVPLGAAQTIADEIDGLRAEIARLKPAADKWMSLPEDVQIDAEVSAAARRAA